VSFLPGSALLPARGCNRSGYCGNRSDHCSALIFGIERQFLHRPVCCSRQGDVASQIARLERPDLVEGEAGTSALPVT
jgi:hypothetical protein